MTTYPLSIRTIETIEQQLFKDWETFEAMQEVKRQQGPLPEDLEHPEKLMAETSESIDEFVRCYGEHLAFEVTLKPGEISQAEVPLLEAVAAASGRMSGLLRRVLAAGLEAEALSEQVSQGIRQAKMACEGVPKGKVS